MSITIIGTGYVGLVTAAVFAKLGNKVWGLDIDKEKIKSLKNGKIPFYEPGLKKLLDEGLKKGNLKFTTSYQKVIPTSEIIFICVGTPPKKSGDFDLSYVYAASRHIAKYLQKYAVIVIKSTVPPGTGDEVRKIISQNTKVPFDVVSVPEFLREGSAVEDSFHPSRIVIGTESKKAKDLLLKLHQPIKAPRVICDLNSAQLIKYAANAFLATKISFINSIARICDKVRADIKLVTKGLSLDPRIGDKFLDAGLGYGGSCFPKDTWALISFAKRKGIDFSFLKEVDKVNKTQIDYFVKKVVEGCGSVSGKKLAVLGLSFKPNTSDMREARSIPIIKKLQKMGAKIVAHDPVAIPEAKKLLKKVKFVKNPYEVVKGAGALILVTEWDDYKELNFAKVKKLMKKPIVIDGRNFLPAKELKRLGFTYKGIGQ